YFPRHAGGRQQAHRRKRCYTVARSALTNYGNGFTCMHMEINISNDRFPAAIAFERGGQIFNGQDRLNRRFNIIHHQLSFARRGSTRSRNASPTSCSERTEKTIASPGKIISHGALFIYSRPEASIVPQVGISAETPTPKNDRLASASIAEAKTNVACTRIGERRLRRIWRDKICQVGNPSDIAAST